TRRIAVPGGEIALVDESYNANPISMRATIGTLAAAPHRRIAVLTDMLELGPDAPRHHAALAAELESADVDQVFLAGPLMHHLWDALPAARRGAWAPGAAELAPTVVSAVRAGDTVMVKGSNGSKASLIVQALSATYPSSTPTPAGAPRP
ncbi:MAG: cyanophycin synthetase, partial [Caulobacteraceae bacterium]